jgi:hypothetical protein
MRINIRIPLSTTLYIIYALFISLPSAIGQEFSSLEAQSPFAVSANTGEKPQSKIWTYNGRWWAVMPNSSGTKLWALIGNNWVEELSLSSSTDTHADAKVMGDTVHILLFRGRYSELISLQYSSSTQSYGFWTVRPSAAAITLDSGVETSTIDIDSNGRMWLASDAVTDVNVRWSDSPYSSWSSAINLANNISSDDISAIVAFSGNIGVLWSNQNTQRFGFKFHSDGSDPSIWSSDEVPASQSALNIGAGMADDHLNFAAASDGTIYAAVKTSYDTPGYPKIGLLIRRPNGSWDDFYSIDDSGTRGIALLNEIRRTITVVYTTSEGNNTIVYRQSYLSPISFSSRKTLISGANNDATSTKQAYSDEAVILASDGSTAVGVLATAGIGLIDSLVGYWSMNEGGGTVLADSSTYHNNGTLFGNPSWVQGIKGLALDLNGSTQYGIISDNSSLDVSNTITLAAWFKPESRGTQRIIYKTDGVSGYELFLEGQNPFRVSVRFNGSIRLNSTSSYPIDGEWMHVAATWDGNTIRMYINGEEENSMTATSPIGTNSSNLGIGATAAGDESFNGQLDEVYIFRRALNITEIQTLATRSAIQHFITASAGANGNINPAGTIWISEGGNQSFSITPNSSYHIADVLVDGISVGPVESYIFSNIISNHTISVIFAANVTGNVARWTMDEGSGAVLFDSSGHGNSAVIIGSPTWVSGIKGMALQITGSQYAMAADNSNLDLSDEITIAAWIKPNSAGNQSIIKKAITSGYSVDGYELSLAAAGSSHDHRPYIRFNQATHGDTYALYANSQYPSDGNTWMHIAATYDGDTMKIYINGILDNIVPAAFLINTNSLSLGIGAQSDGTNRYSGALDDIRIYSYALNASEINSLVGINHPPNPPTLVTPAQDTIGVPISPLLSAIVSDPDIDYMTVAFWGRISGLEAAGAIPLEITSISTIPKRIVNSDSLSRLSFETENKIPNNLMDNGVSPLAKSDTRTVIFDNYNSSTQNSKDILADNFQNIGEFHNVPSGSTVSMQWLGLLPLTDYEWYISVGDDSSTTNGAIWSFTTENINHTITATSNGHGIIFPSGQIAVPQGQDTTFTIFPEIGYHILDVNVDSVPMGPISSYSFTNITASHTISATFAINTYTIIVSVGSNGTIMPSNDVILDYGANQTFNISPDSSCYHIADVIVDSVSVGPVNSFTFTSITANHTISAFFAIDTFIIQTFAPPYGGAITPSGNVPASCCENIIFNITAFPGYHLADVLIDSVSVGPLSSFTFTCISANHSIAAIFGVNIYTIVAASGPNGTVSPSGEISVQYGQDQSFEIIPDFNYPIADVIVDGVSMGPIDSFIFENVSENHTIDAAFGDGVAPIITSYPPQIGMVNQTYIYNVEAIGVPEPKYYLLLHPDSMTIDSVSGLIQWIPTHSCEEAVIVTANNSVGIDSQTFSINIAGCSYIAGDVNQSGFFNGIDVTYGVAYFKGGNPPPNSCDCNGSIWYVAGDVNGNCQYNGIDIVYMVSFFKGGPQPVPCASCPPQAPLGLSKVPNSHRAPTILK